MRKIAITGRRKFVSATPVFLLAVLAVGCDASSPPADRPPPEGMIITSGGFRIDVTEVTHAQYAEFLLDVPAGATDAPCEWKESFVPADWDPEADPRLPVTGLDWCDARAYCRSVGKRLCGAIGGGNVDPMTDHADATANEWFHACTNGGERAWPYGATHAPGTCHDFASDGHLERAGATVTCEGGVAGLFDMSGNAWEWIDSCFENAQRLYCELRGGGVSTIAGDAPFMSSCAVSSAILFDAYLPLDARMPSFGARCCADL